VIARKIGIDGPSWDGPESISLVEALLAHYAPELTGVRGPLHPPMWGELKDSVRALAYAGVTLIAFSNKGGVGGRAVGPSAAVISPPELLPIISYCQIQRSLESVESAMGRWFTHPSAWNGHVAQQDSWLTSLSKVWPASFRPSTCVK